MAAPGDDPVERSLAGIAALDQPIRRDLYRLLRAGPGDWTSRDEAAEALGVARAVAAFHLDKLVTAGVVEVRFERRTGRTGPGAGRPAKLYRATATEVAASVPDRHYDLAASLLASAVAESARTGEPADDCLRRAARAAGRTAGDAEAVSADDGPPRPDLAIDTLLRDHGYEPTTLDDGVVALANCPFHRLADEQRDLVCGMNLAFLDGLLDGAGATDTHHAHLRPEPGYCCVRIALR